MKKHSKLYTLLALIILIVIVAFLQLDKQNRKKETVRDIYDNFVILTNDAGDDITEQFKEEYAQAYQEGKYSLIYTALEDVEYTRIYDNQGNKVPIH